MKWMNKMRSFPAMVMSSVVICLELHLVLYILLGVPYWIFFLFVVIPISVAIGIFYPISSQKNT